MNVRPATVSDAARIAHIHVATWRTAYRGLMPDDYLAGLSEDRRADFWRKRLAESRGAVIVCERDGEVVGFCDLVSSRDTDAEPVGVGEIAAIYVLPKHWRRGVGVALCRCAMQMGQSLGFSMITIWVLETNIPAIRFYEAQGLRPDGARKKEKLTSDFEITEVRYVLELVARSDPEGKASAPTESE
jgi:ribosomal protein S18 acetylase RimI-like enzyme